MKKEARERIKSKNEELTKKEQRRG